MISKLMTILFLPLVSYAGWVGGGGGFIRDSENPWFLKNTQVVQYCIKIDEKNFGIDRELASERITQAIEYWKKELAISRTNWPAQDEMGIGTQKFIEVNCSSSADVEFLLGMLPDEEAPGDWMPTSFIGVTIRTQYDQENMRGKGFIYISPGSGPLKYKNKELVDNAWTIAEGHVFQTIVMHELGHMFGLSHENGNNTSHLMHRSYPEMLLNKENWDAESRLDSEKYIKIFNPAIFKYRPENSDFWTCVGAIMTGPEQKDAPKFLLLGETSNTEFWGDRMKFFEVLEVPEEQPCLWNRIFENKVEILLNKISGQPSVLLGTAKIEWEDNWFSDNALISIWLPPAQKVIPVTEWAPMFISAGHRREYSKFKGTYVSVDGKVKREIFGRARLNESLELGGKLGDKVFLRLF